MESSNATSDAFAKVKEALAPYVKSRQEVFRIRQALGAHLDRQFEYKTGHTRISPLSLSSDYISETHASANLQGIQKDYVKTIRANIKARQEYDRLCEAAIVRTEDSRTQRNLTGDMKYSITAQTERKDFLYDYLDLVKQGQRHDRLRILQDYLDKLEQKFAATTSYLSEASTSVCPLPKVPVDVLANTGADSPESARKDLLDLTVDLERAVLGSKFYSRNERIRLEKAREVVSSLKQNNDTLAQANEKRLQALSQTRNELIRWIEDELGKSGEPSTQNQDENTIRSKTRYAGFNTQRLSFVKDQYSRYVDARTAFLEAFCDQGNHDPFSVASSTEESDFGSPERKTAPIKTRVALPLLKDLLSISNEQKSLIQQKSHLTVSLAKQHKETNLALDRLADESHLLPAFALLTRKASRVGLGQLDTDEPLGKEMPDTAHRASSWVQAADLASSELKDAVVTNLEDGELAIESARQHLSRLEQLLPQKALSQLEHLDKEYMEFEDIWVSERTLTKPKTKGSLIRPKSSPFPGSIWASLEGNLGVLQVDHDNEVAYSGRNIGLQNRG